MQGSYRDLNGVLVSTQTNKESTVNKSSSDEDLQFAVGEAPAKNS